MYFERANKVQCVLLVPEIPYSLPATIFQGDIVGQFSGVLGGP